MIRLDSAQDEQRFLLVNDDLYSLEIIKMQLNALKSVNVETAVNGDLAVRIVMKNMQQFYHYFNEIRDGNADSKKVEEPKHFDAIILDLNMPIMDGFEACRRIIQIYEQYNLSHIAPNVDSNL